MGDPTTPVKLRGFRLVFHKACPLHFLPADEGVRGYTGHETERSAI